MSAKGGSVLKIDEVARLVTEEAKKDGRVDGVFGFNTAKRPPLSSVPSKDKANLWIFIHISIFFFCTETFSTSSISVELLVRLVMETRFQ
uniref:Uncharacterized protein n=1 Tax=Syphacia muris TaxID=451379 RepID=A0A0N5AJJ9_9BILA